MDPLYAEGIFVCFFLSSLWPSQFCAMRLKKCNIENIGSALPMRFFARKLPCLQQLVLFLKCSGLVPSSTVFNSLISVLKMIALYDKKLCHYGASCFA